MAKYEPLDASRICSGTYGRVFENGKWKDNINECTMDAEIDLKEVNLVGAEWQGHKKGIKKGTGTIKGYKVDSDMIKNGFNKKEILTELDDPEAWGAERIRFKNVQASKVNFVNFKAGELCEEETPVVWSGYELVDPIERD